LPLKPRLPVRAREREREGNELTCAAIS
jgi:hypothetical protein